MRIDVRKAERKELDELGVFGWPIWTKEPSKFDWHYEDREMCFFLEGDVTVSSKAGEVRIGAGDLVAFPQGLDCTWHVHKAVRKHYRFG